MARILVVEDSPDNMKLFRAVLRMHGHEIVELPDGQGLLTLVSEATPDLVLMDIQLPGEDGFQLLEKLRGGGFGHIPVIALTAHAMAGDVERALVAGFHGYITKPIDVRQFPTQVANALQGKAGTGLA